MKEWRKKTSSETQRRVQQASLSWTMKTTNRFLALLLDRNLSEKTMISYAGWWFQPLRKIWVSWDDYPQYSIYIYGKITNVPNHQPVWHLWCMTIIDIQCGAGGHQTAKLTPAFVNLHFATTFVGQLEGGEKAKTARIEEGRQCNDPRPT